MNAPTRPAERYGDRSAPLPRRTVVAVASLVAVVSVAWIGWAALGRPDARIKGTTVGYRVLDATTVEVTYDVSRPPGTEVDCVLRALDRAKATVGTVTVRVPAQEQQSVRRTDRLRTTGPAVTGLVRSCTAR